MSERFNVDVDDVLGSSYYVTSLTSSSYNATIDGTVTVTVNLKDVYGTNVNGASVTVTASSGTFTQLNGSNITAAASVTGTTNASGTFTLTYKCSEWGLITFSANNTSMQIRVTGWKEVSVTGATSYATLYVNGEERLASFRYYRASYNFTATTTVTLHTNAIPSSYRPPAGVNMDMLRSDLTGSVNEDGDISVVSWATGSKTINMSAMWRY